MRISLPFHYAPAIALAALSLSGSATAEPPSRTVAEDAVVLESGRLRARQNALARLAAHPDAEADKVLRAQFARFRTGDLPLALWLDLFEAAAKRDDAGLKAMLAERERELEKSTDPLIRFRECLEGGDAEAGREVFTKKPEAGCVRCHSVEGKGGQIGPDLTWLRRTTERIHILESLILPNSTIATGFQSVSLKLKNGREISGVVSSESTEELTITSIVDGKKTRVPAADIVERTPMPSPMPPHFGVALNKRAIRDLIEFIAVGD